MTTRKVKRSIPVGRSPHGIYFPSHALPVEELLARHFPEADIVLVEGFKGSALPKIEVHRSGVSRGLVCRGAVNDPALVAVAGDGPLSVDVPVLPLGDPSAVADFLERRYLRVGSGA